MVSGRSPSGVGPLAEGGAASSTASPAKPSVPNAGLEQRLYAALEQIRSLADGPLNFTAPAIAQRLDAISDVATLACAKVWERRVA